jgi:hypothetical protein
MYVKSGAIKLSIEMHFVMFGRLARWYILKPKIPIWVKLGGSFNVNVGILYVIFPFWYVVPIKLWQP